MKFKHLKQTGSVMIEAAFIVPIVILSVILTIDAVNFGAEKIMLNNAVHAVSQDWKTRAETTSVANKQEPFTCEGSFPDVSFDGNQNTFLEGFFKSALKIKQDVSVTSVIASGGSGNTGSILDKTHTFRISYKFDGLVLPSLDVGTYMMFTLDSTCAGS